MDAFLTLVVFTIVRLVVPASILLVIGNYVNRRQANFAR